MKTYVLTLSEYFPASHPCKGNKTHFYDKIMAGKKLHTIRANPELWAKRAIEVREGRAQISVRQWTGKPYQPKQIELFRLGHKTVFKQITLCNNDYYGFCYFFNDDRDYKLDINNLAKKDGLTGSQFIDWFKLKPCAEIDDVSRYFEGMVIYFNDILK